MPRIVTSRLRLPEPAARRVLLLRAYETAEPAAAVWSAGDRDWATRVARASLGVAVAPQRFVEERTRLALGRLAERDGAVRRAVERHPRLATATALAVLAAAAAGLLVDRIGADRRIDLLAWPMAMLLAWNLAVYLWTALGAAGLAAPARLRRALQRHLDDWTAGVPRPGAPAAQAPPLQRFAADWSRTAAPLNAARAAAVLHLAAAALALGVVGGLYARGLVLDYRAGWESTLLDAATVQRLLEWLLAPASWATGIPLPDVGPLRVRPGELARGDAAPWLHLMAATLAVGVVAPRLGLAAVALARVVWLRHRLPLPGDDPWLQRQLAEGGGDPVRAWVLAHARALAAPAAMALRDRLAARLGPGLSLVVAEPLPYGQEDDAARCTPPPGTTQVLLVVDLATTPEAEVHGRWLDTVAAAAPAARRVLLADPASMAARSAHDPGRLAVRRAAWQRLASDHGAGFAALDDDDALARALGR